jgi:hypothetical protein
VWLVCVVCVCSACVLHQVNERPHVCCSCDPTILPVQSKSFLFHPDENLLRFLSEKIVVVRTEDTLWDLSYGLEKRTRAQ